MELGSSRVWDYAGDNYVHRLVQNKADGKLVEVDEQSAGEQEEKIDALNLEVNPFKYSGNYSLHPLMHRCNILSVSLQTNTCSVVQYLFTL